MKKFFHWGDIIDKIKDEEKEKEKEKEKENEEEKEKENEEEKEKENEEEKQEEKKEEENKDEMSWREKNPTQGMEPPDDLEITENYFYYGWKNYKGKIEIRRRNRQNTTLKHVINFLNKTYDQAWRDKKFLVYMKF